MDGATYFARSWMAKWDATASAAVRKASPALFFIRKEDKSYAPAGEFHYSTLVLGGKFLAAKDPLGGLDARDTAIVDIFDPDVELFPHIHLGSEGIALILSDINIMTEEEANYLRGPDGVYRVVQSNIGGPNQDISDLHDVAKAWISGEVPGCCCLICSRVPSVLAKLQRQADLTPADVLPLTTVPRLAQVVDKWLQPCIKIDIGSQGIVGVDQFQTYPSAAVGFLNYPAARYDAQARSVQALSADLDPKGVFRQRRAPHGYRYVQGFFWENGKDVIRRQNDKDQHVFGFVYVRKNARLSDDVILEEAVRFQPHRGDPALPCAFPGTTHSKGTCCICCQGSGCDAHLGTCPLCDGAGHFEDEDTFDAQSAVKDAPVQQVEEGTRKVYWQETYTYEYTARFVRGGLEGESSFVVLDQTIFHAQGGGQPADTGTIRSGCLAFRVSVVKEVGEEVFHYGSYDADDEFKVGSEVALKIDPELRQAFARRHSAAHLLDQSCILLGYKLMPLKGFITESASYSEYDGDIPAKERPSALVALQQKVNELVRANTPVSISTVDGKRIVEMAGYVSPCSGTHVESTGEIGNLVLEKLKVKNGKLRITFDLAAN